MAEDLLITGTTKEEKYRELLPCLESLISGETDLIANMANVAAALKQTFDFFWIGFYRLKDEMLVLGPFQGPVACTRIRYGKGVCGSAWQRAETIIVPNVNEFPGHIACSSRSRSEIVVPVFCKELIIGVLDIDSEHTNNFDATDAFYLEKVCRLLAGS